MISQLLVFDLDGTLIDSRADLTAAINHMRAHFAMEPLSLATVSGYIGNGTRKLVERALQGRSVDFDEAMRLNRAYYMEHLTVHTTLYAGVADGLARLAVAGHRLALLTNKPGDPSRAILHHFGVAQYFDAIVGGGDAAALKPDPTGIRDCMAATGIPAERTWMIGDHYTDLESARNAGVRSGLVRYGFGDACGLEPDRDFASFDALVRYFVGS